MGTYMKKGDEKNQVWLRKLTEEDSDIVLALNEGLKGAGCHILNLIIMVTIMKIAIDSVIMTMLSQWYDV